MEDPTALSSQTTELLQIFGHYVEISGRPDSSKQSNYRNTGKIKNTMLKSVEDPTALKPQTTELQANFRTLC